VTFRLNAIAHTFRPGHRLRLAISTCYWPMLWPSPEPVTLALYAGTSRLVLPVRPPRAEDATLAAFGEPEAAAPLPLDVWTEGRASRTVARDLGTGAAELVYAYGGGRRVLPNGIELEDAYRETFAIVEGDPLSARVRVEAEVAVGRGRWRTRVETRSALRADAAAFHLENTVTAYEGEQRVFTRTWTRSVPRDLV